ncbi:MAG: rRNA processing protein RimM [Actinomycetota bacterium]
MSTESELREIGKTGRAHGVRGDISVDLMTDRVERLAVGARLQLGDRWLTVAAARPAGNRWLVHFEGFDDRTAVEVLQGQALLAEPLPPTDDEDALYVHDLVGAEVLDEAGTSYGRCTAVLANPAHDILELESGALVPVVFVVSNTAGRVVIAPPDGLFDLD